SNLIERAAGVALKERRPLVLLARETPLSTIHLEQMATVSRAGATVMPPLPALYLHPGSIEEMVALIIQRALTCLGALQKPQKGWKHETK
ncbi:MAG: flavoprotein, partial [Spirochaetota bacterium]